MANLIKEIFAKLEMAYVSLIKISIIVLCVFIFILFRKIELNEGSNLKKNIETILRSETFVANSYALSKTLVDLETVGLVNCSKLSEINNNGRVFYDSLNNKKCLNFFNLVKKSEKIEMRSSSGITFELEYYLNRNVFAILFEGILYIIFSVLYFILPNIFNKIVLKNDIKLRALEIEKNILLDQTKQVSHDVASPLSAIKLVVGLLKNIDPEIKDILINSINRTQMIFDDLKKARDFTSSVNANICVREIAKEKKLIWGDDCAIYFDDLNLKNSIVKANELEFKRIISNILNNSFESFCGVAGKKIDIHFVNKEGYLFIMIKDDGCGIPSDIIEKIGIKGFSFGKNNLGDSGSGLGLYHAMSSVKNWGGEIKIASNLNEGTEITIKLKNIV